MSNICGFETLIGMGWCRGNKISYHSKCCTHQWVPNEAFTFSSLSKEIAKRRAIFVEMDEKTSHTTLKLAWSIGNTKLSDVPLHKGLPFCVRQSPICSGTLKQNILLKWELLVMLKISICTVGRVFFSQNFCGHCYHFLAEMGKIPCCGRPESSSSIIW